jgi:hypothetical protein
VRRFTLVLLPAIVALPLHESGAQIIRGGRFGLREPQTWVTGGIGVQQGWTVIDGASSSRWELADATSYGGSIERAVSSGVTLGVRANTARVAMDYVSTGLGGFVEADGRVSQALAMLHVSAGRDLHSVLELGAGATFYSGFRDRTTGQKLAPDRPDADFTFVFGYGIGYSFSRAFQIDVVQDLATAMHQKAGLSAGDDSSVRISSTRLVARLGFGS